MFVQEDQEKSHHSDEDKLQALRNGENQSARYYTPREDFLEEECTWG